MIKNQIEHQASLMRGLTPVVNLTIDPAINEIWLKVLSILEKKIRKPSFQTWIRPSLLSSINDTEAVVAVRNEFTRNFLMQSYQKEIQSAITEVMAQALALRIVIEPELDYSINELRTSDQIQVSLAAINTSLDKINPVNTQFRKAKTKLEPKYNFNNLYQAEFNQSAITFAKAIIENGSGFYNSLFIYSAPGLGKTHLLHALGNSIAKIDQDIRVRYVKAEEFTNELIISIQRNQTQEFRNQYRNLDLLLFDDFQFLEGKKTCQEEFLYTFDALISSGAKVIITAQKNIDDIKLSSNLNNKIKSSLLSQINAPSFTDRIAIINNKSQASEMGISDIYAETIARKYPNSIRELEAALYQISAYKNFAGENIDDELIARLFGGISSEPRNKGLSIEKISSTVADYFSLKNKELIGKKRLQDITRARHIAIYLSHELLEISYSRIGEYFGGRKHSSIIHSIKTVNSQLQSKLPSAGALKSIILDIKAKI